MFIKDHQRYKDGKNHHYYSLCETVRTERGPRHKKVCYIGELNSEGYESLEKRTRVREKTGESKEVLLFPDMGKDIAYRECEADVARVKLSGVHWRRPRKFGEVYLGWNLWQRLGLDEFLKEVIDEKEDKADVPWSMVSAVLSINRLCDPRSELYIDEQWYKQTALDDIIGISDKKIQKDRLYRCLDLLIKRKEEVEKHLKRRWGDLFGAKYDILLYDLTSTYFEGEANANPQAKRGYSRDKRPDCKQVVVALIVSQEGFPFAFEVMDGNRRDVTTLEDMFDNVEGKYGYARRIWIFDRGVVSEENLKLLRKRKTPYVVGTPRSALKDFEAELVSSDWHKIKEEVEVHNIKRVTGKESYVLIRSHGRLEKEKAMRRQAMNRLEKELKKLAKQIKKGWLKDEKKIYTKIGQHLNEYKSVRRFYKTELKKKDKKLEFSWNILQDKLRWKEITEGTYLIRTNVTNINQEQLWNMYMQLTEAEAAFRVIKSELSVRPIWHKHKNRVQAHIMVAFLGYALWVTLKHLLKGSSYFHPYDYDVSPWKALNMLSRIESGDIVLPTTDGKTIVLRRISAPDQECKLLLEKLKIKLPERLGTDIVM